MSKIFRYTILITLLVSILYSCNTKTDSVKSVTQISAENKYTQQVNFMGQWMGEGKRESIVTDYVRQYEFVNQEVDVNLKFPEEIGFNRYDNTSTHEYIQKILGQETPEWDVLLINDDFEGIREIMGEDDWAQKYLVDFSVYPELANSTIPEIDLDVVKKRWGGIIPGPFLEGQYWAMWSNVNVTKKLGIEVKQFGMTFDDFLGYLKAVDDYNKTHDDYITPIKEANDWRTAFSSILNLFLSEVNDIEEIKGEYPSQRKIDAWYKVLQALEMMAQYSPIDENWNTLVWNDTRMDLLNEECLFFSNGSWMYNIWVEEDSARVMNCVPNEYPVFENQSPLYPAAFPVMWAVPKNSPNKEAAVKMLLDMSTPAMAEKWVRSTKCPTGILGSINSSQLSVDHFEAFSNHVTSTYGSNTFKMMENSSWVMGSRYPNMPIYFMEVITGEMTADEAMVLINQYIVDNEITI